MAVQHLTDALSSYDIEWRVPIMQLVSQHLPSLYSVLDERGLHLIAQELSQVSGGSGMDILGLLLLDDSNPGLIERISDDIRWRIDRYTSGVEYPVHLIVNRD